MSFSTDDTVLKSVFFSFKRSDQKMVDANENYGIVLNQFTFIFEESSDYKTEALTFQFTHFLGSLFYFQALKCFGEVYNMSLTI